jgi:predicted nucleic acid-binding protein
VQAPDRASRSGRARAAGASRLYFLDTSAFAKLYIREEGSWTLARWVGQRTVGFFPSVRLYVSRMVLPETVSAITRRRNDRKLRAPEAVRLWHYVFDDFMRRRPVYQIIEPTEDIVLRAALLVATHGLRGYDAVQLASALWLQVRLSDPDALVFVCSDTHLSAAARAERLAVADPLA